MRTTLWLAIGSFTVCGACQKSVEPDAAPRPPESTAPSPADAIVSDKREYQCGEIAVSADFHGTGPVRLRFDGNELTLPQVISASGARYADADGNEFWSKGDEATFTLSDQPRRDCSPAATPPPD